MTVGYRAMGARDASLPQATGEVYGFFRDPNRFPYTQYVQLVGLPEESNGVYMYPIIEPDEPARLVNYAEFAYGWDDRRPRGEGFKPRVKWVSSETTRYAFGYTIGDRTQRAWTNKTKLNPRALYDRVRVGHAALHRASRAVDFVRSHSFPSYNTSTLQALMGTPTPAVYYDLSSGVEYLPSGNPNPNFQIIKESQNRIMRRIDLQTNGALTGEEFVMVMGPKVAQKIATSGEIVNYLKQSQYAQPALMVRNGKWGIPDTYNGWKMVVEDTPRVFVRKNKDDQTFAAAGTATTTVPPGATLVYNERDYVWNDDTILFCSRVGGLDGNYGYQNYSTVQMFYYNGLVNVVGKQDTFDGIFEGSIDIEDDFQMPVDISGFLLTGVLSAIPS